MSGLERIMAQVKNLSDQRPPMDNEQLVVIAANGQSTPILCDFIQVYDNWFTAYRRSADGVTASALVYACPREEAHVYSLAVVNLRTVDELSRESFAAQTASRKLAEELLGPETGPLQSMPTLPIPPPGVGQYL